MSHQKTKNCSSDQHVIWTPYCATYRLVREPIDQLAGPATFQGEGADNAAVLTNGLQNGISQLSLYSH